MNIKQELINKLSDSGMINLDTMSLIEYLFEVNLLDESAIRRTLIRCEYYDLLKDNSRSCFDIKLDIAIKFNVSEAFVSKCIYSYTHNNF